MSRLPTFTQKTLHKEPTGSANNTLLQETLRTREWLDSMYKYLQTQIQNYF